MNYGNWKDGLDYISGHQVKLMRSGPELFRQLISMVNDARKFIHVQIYIIDPDETGTPFLNALMAAAKRGVKVYLMVDDFGSDKLEPELEEALKSSGIIYKRFEPLLTSERFYVGRRMHHKVMVIDEKTGMVGGMNVAIRYHGTKEEPAWLDYAVIVTGPVCVELTRVCIRIFEKKFKLSRPRFSRMFPVHPQLDPSEVWVRIRRNDSLRNKQEITRSYNRAVRLSKNYITIVGGYFLPGRHFRQLLAAAAARGVEINIIMARFSDVQVVKYASDYLYGWLLRHKIRVYESNSTMVHGKVAIMDGIWTTVGSYNQNHLSAYISIELNLDIVNKQFSEDFNAHLLSVIKNECTEVTAETYHRKANVFAKLRRWVSYQLVRLSLRTLFVVHRIFNVND